MQMAVSLDDFAVLDQTSFSAVAPAKLRTTRGSIGILANVKIGMTTVAAQAGVTRASLYKALSEDGQPAFETVFNVVRSFGLTLAVR